MKGITSVLLLSMVAFCSSCGARKEKAEAVEFMSRLANVERDFCSSNVTVAESGLLAHRQWLLQSMAAGQSYNHNLFQTDARLFQICEFKGDTNKAEVFYQEGRQAYERHLHSEHRLEDPISREELRARLTHQQQGQNVAWKTANTN